MGEAVGKGSKEQGENQWEGAQGEEQGMCELGEARVELPRHGW